MFAHGGADGFQPGSFLFVRIFAGITCLLQVRQADGIELVFIELLHVMEVDPVELFDVEDGRVLGDAVEGELFIAAEDFLIAFRRPAEEGQEVDQCVGQVAHIAVLLDRCSAMALAHLLLVGAEDERYVSELRGFKAQCLVDDQLARRVGQVFFRTDDVGDVHEGIVEDDAVVIDRDAVGFDDDEVADVVGIEGYVTADEVVQFNRFVLRRLDADDVGTAFLEVLFDRFFGQVSAFAGVDRRFPFGQLSLFFRFQFFRRAEAVVGLAFGQELFRIFLINAQAFSLAVRAIGTADVDAFIPGDAQPFQGFLDVFFRFRRRTLAVRIFDADDELTVVVLGNEVVEQCRTGTADVERACRARSKTNAYFL